MVNEPASRRAYPRGALFSEWAAPDGTRLRRMDWTQPEGAKARGSLLFAAGRGDFIEKYLEVLAYWHAAGWNLTTFDWRGQGRSQAEGGGAARDDFDAMAKDLAALVEDWRAASPGPHVAVGHSMGGHLLLRALVERRPALDAAVLVAPMIQVNSGPIPAWLAPRIADTMWLLGRGARPMWRAPAAFTRPGGRRHQNLTGSRERYEDELWWWDEQPGYNLGAPTWGWTRAGYRSAAAAFTRRRLAGVDLPILILGAEQDRLVGAAAIRRVAADLPRAEIEMLPDSAHEILREADPVRLRALARIDTFLARHAP